jgi:Flp pilus assembly protein TadD
MSHDRPFLPRSLRVLALVAALMGPVLASADDYGDVNQLMRTGRHGEALAKAEQFLAAKPRDPQMRFMRGVILSETGRTDEAINAFLRLTEDYPELPEPYNNLAVLHAGQAQFEKARAALEMAVRVNPRYAVAHENLGDVYAKLAAVEYAKAQQLDAANTTVAPKLTLIRQLFERPRAQAAPAR